MLSLFYYSCVNVSDCNHSISHNHINNNDKAHTVEDGGVTLQDIDNGQEKQYRFSDGRVSPESTDHSHTFTVLSNQFTSLNQTNTITVTSTSYNIDNHTHDIQIECNQNSSTTAVGPLKINNN